MIERLIEPVVRHPLLAEWRGVHTQIAATLTTGAAAKPGSKLKRDAPKQPETLLGLEVNPYVFVSRLAIAVFSENLPARVVICLARRTN